MNYRASLFIIGQFVKTQQLRTCEITKSTLPTRKRVKMTNLVLSENMKEEKVRKETWLETVRVLVGTSCIIVLCVYIYTHYVYTVQWKCMHLLSSFNSHTLPRPIPFKFQVSSFKFQSKSNYANLIVYEWSPLS